MEDWYGIVYELTNGLNFCAEKLQGANDVVAFLERYSRQLEEECMRLKAELEECRNNTLYVSFGEGGGE